MFEKQKKQKTRCFDSIKFIILASVYKNYTVFI